MATDVEIEKEAEVEVAVGEAYELSFVAEPLGVSPPHILAFLAGVQKLDVGDEADVGDGAEAGAGDGSGLTSGISSTCTKRIPELSIILGAPSFSARSSRRSSNLSVGDGLSG